MCCCPAQPSSALQAGGHASLGHLLIRDLVKVASPRMRATGQQGFALWQVSSGRPAAATRHPRLEVSLHRPVLQCLQQPVAFPAFPGLQVPNSLAHFEPSAVCGQDHLEASLRLVRSRLL